MADAPQVAYGQESKQVYQHDGNHMYPIATSTTTPMSTKQDAYTDYDEAHRPMRPPPTILGLRKRNFWVLLGFAVVVVAAAVGGSIGGSMAVRNTGNSKTEAAKSQSASPSPTPASGTPSAFRAASAAASATPASTAVSFPTIPKASEQKLIDKSCPDNLKDWSGKAYDCFEGGNVAGQGDITGITAYTMQQCIDACGTWNHVSSLKCAAVILSENLGFEYGVNFGANCWLKNVSGPLDNAKKAGAMFAVLKT